MNPVKYPGSKRAGSRWSGTVRCAAAALAIALPALPAAAAPATATASGPAAPARAAAGLTGIWVIDQHDFDRRETPPYTPEALALASQEKAAVESGKVISDEALKCLPHGMPTMMLTEFAMEILETPGRVTVISESSPLVRSIYLNRTKPTEGLEPMWNGYSIGHWEGGTLVVKTNNFNDKSFPLGFGGAVHASTTTVTERISLSADGQTLVDELTMEDARYLTRPFTLVRHYARQPEDAELWEYACEIGAGGWSERFKGDKDAAKGGL